MPDMAGETVISVIGNLTADPEARQLPNGSNVANFTVASTPRLFDRKTNEWKDGDTLYMRCNVWNDQAKNVRSSLAKGMRVIVVGTLKTRHYETKEGEKRTITELDVLDVGPSLKSAEANVQRNEPRERSQQGGTNVPNGYAAGQAWPNRAPQQGGGQQQAWGGPQQQTYNDPWSTGQETQPPF